MNLEVHVDWQKQTLLVGRLYAADHGAAVTFEYDREWLGRPGAFAIDPVGLPLQAGKHHAPALFGAMQDCGPDRWGRVLIARAVRKGVLEAKPYRDIDYVLALDDHSRIGALRFCRPEGRFLAEGTGRLPPVLRLGALVAAADAIHCETETAEQLRYLLGVGSPLGGARPKSAIALPDNTLAIAKFPKPDDKRDIEGGEILVLDLAQAAGVTTAAHQLVKSAGKHVAVITRFDRYGPERIPFVSAATLLGLAPGVAGSYVHLAEGIRQHGHDVTGDLRELWRRMVFSLLVSNHDDHMRNHGFLLRAPGKWALSPAYDLNPVPKIDRVDQAQTSIDGSGAAPTIARALAAAVHFGLKPKEAKMILSEVTHALNGWREAGARLRLNRGTLADYATAFDHSLMTEAQAVSGGKITPPASLRQSSGLLAAARVPTRTASRPHRGISP